MSHSSQKPKHNNDSKGKTKKLKKVTVKQNTNNCHSTRNEVSKN